MVLERAKILEAEFRWKGLAEGTDITSALKSSFGQMKTSGETFVMAPMTPEQWYGEFYSTDHWPLPPPK